MSITSWWQGLADRERRVVTIGGGIVALLFVYLLIWSPLSSAVSDNQAQAESQRQLLVYLKQSAQQIQTLRSSGIVAAQSVGNDLMGTVEQTLSEQKLSGYLKKVQQVSSTQITLGFNAVPFDELMQWLQSFSTAHGVSVVQFSALETAVAGESNVQITLSAK